MFAYILLICNPKGTNIKLGRFSWLFRFFCITNISKTAIARFPQSWGFLHPFKNIFLIYHMTPSFSIMYMNMIYVKSEKFILVLKLEDKGY